jgi:hypothetical protein
LIRGPKSFLFCSSGKSFRPPVSKGKQQMLEPTPKDDEPVGVASANTAKTGKKGAKKPAKKK